MIKEHANQIAAQIICMYEEHGGEEYAGEPVSQLEHMVQTAMLAENQGHDEEVILAAFLHDIGHICVAYDHTNSMRGYGIVDHEAVGGAFLRENGFSERLVMLVESHVAAKRYLTWKYPEYYEQLSDASKATLEFQGGIMTMDEARELELHPLFPLIILMRKWDEAAKIPGAPIPTLSKYSLLISNHLHHQQGSIYTE